MAHEALLKSVTLGDQTEDAGRKGAVLNFFIGSGPGLATAMPPVPPVYWSPRRDAVLRQTIFQESGWGSAIYIAITKMASLSFRLKGLGLKARRSRDLLMGADDGKGWVRFLSRHLRDYLTTDNGVFIEIVRASDAAGSRILGIFHLDSARCTRTGDPERPVIYRDRVNKYHELRDYQVISLSDLTDPADTWYGVGFCAASRAYKAIYRMTCIENYLTEKVTGKRVTKFAFVSGISDTQLNASIATAEQQAASKGYAQYLGAVMIPNIDPTAPAQVAEVDLVSMPDGFNGEQERRNAYLVYADAIGLDPQELDPQLLASRALGTGAQARVIDDKASGKGLVAWRQSFTHSVNEYLTPSDVTFFFSERDYRDRLQMAELQSSRFTSLATLITAQVITPAQALQMLVDSDDVPREFLAQDITPEEEVGEAENPPPEALPADKTVAPSETTQAPPKLPPGKVQVSASESLVKEYAPLRLERAFEEVGT